MEVEINEKNKTIIIDAISDSIEVIQEIGKSIDKEQSDTKRLVLLDLLFRQYPNLNSIGILFTQYFTLNNLGNTLPIGLIIRCSIEDMLYANYLLTFKNDPVVFENEIKVQSRNFISEYFEYLIENEPDHWKCSNEKREAVKSANLEIYNNFKKENPIFFDENGKIKNYRKLRRDVTNIHDYFDSQTIESQGPCSMFKRIKSVDIEFSYIYFEYKFFCLFEHYSLQTRKIMELNRFTFGHLSLSIEFILRAIANILDYLNIDPIYLSKIKKINNSLGGLIK